MLDGFVQAEPSGHGFDAFDPTGQYEPEVQVNRAVDPAGQYLPSVHTAILDGFVQYDPAGHGFDALDPAGQYEPAVQVSWAVEPSGQYLPSEQMVHTPALSYCPAGHTIDTTTRKDAAHRHSTKRDACARITGTVTPPT